MQSSKRMQKQHVATSLKDQWCKNDEQSEDTPRPGANAIKKIYSQLRNFLVRCLDSYQEPTLLDRSWVKNECYKNFLFRSQEKNKRGLTSHRVKKGNYVHQVNFYFKCVQIRENAWLQKIAKIGYRRTKMGLNISFQNGLAYRTAHNRS